MKTDWYNVAVRLLSSHNRKKMEMVLVEGKKLIDTIYRNRRDMICVILSTDSLDDYKDCEFVKIDKRESQKIKQTKTPQSLFAVVKFIDYVDIDSIISSDKILILENVQNPDNVGALIRSAIGFGVHEVVLIGGANVNNFKAIRASSGYLYSIKICRIESLHEMDIIKKKYNVLISNVNEGENIKDFKFLNPSALVLGNEGNGVSRELVEYFHGTGSTLVNINTEVESLNVAVAGSILMYQIFSK